MGEEAQTREQLFAEGRALAALIERQTQRCSVALDNREESRRLEQLQTKWQAWERQAIAAGINPEKEFGRQELELLRPVAANVNPFRRQRRTLSVPELHAIGSRQPPRNQDQVKPSTMPLEKWPLGEHMVSTIDALAEVVRDEKRPKTERDSAMTALRDLAANAETFHERQWATQVLRTLNDGEPTADSEISDHLLRLLYLTDATDTPENNMRAREMYRRQIEVSKPSLLMRK